MSWELTQSDFDGMSREERMQLVGAMGYTERWLASMRDPDLASLEQGYIPAPEEWHYHEEMAEASRESARDTKVH